MKTIRRIGSWFKGQFRKLFYKGTTKKSTPRPVAEAPVQKTRRRVSAKRRRRLELRQLLRRIDGAGKHYGSKRAVSDHRGSGHGKRSGRQ